MEAAQLFSVQGRVALVTGGGRGIGKQIAEGFVRNGATVYICSRKEKENVDTAAALNKLGSGSGGCCVGFAADLSTVAACKAVIKKLSDEYKVDKLDILVNNSGATWADNLDTFSEAAWDKVMNLNVKGMFFLTQAALPLLERAATPTRPARVINIGSIAGIGLMHGPTYSYDVSKAAVHHLTKKLAAALADRHITVNAIAPGLILTMMGKQLLVLATEEQLKSTIALKRFGQAEDMAGVALYLASKAGNWVTGTVIPVDGGALVVSSAKL